MMPALMRDVHRAGQGLDDPRGLVDGLGLAADLLARLPPERYSSEQ